MDGKPLAARIAFGTFKGGVVLESDDEGAFRGVLPRAGRLPVDIVSDVAGVTAELVVDVVENLPGQADVQIDVPSGVLRGVVVDERGQPVAHASVHVAPRSERSRPTRSESEADGSFELRGLPVGASRVQAGATDGRESETVEVRLAEGGPTAELRLVLKRMLGR